MSSAFRLPQAVVDSRHRRALARRPQPCGVCGQWPSVLYLGGRFCPPCAEALGLQPVAKEKS